MTEVIRAVKMTEEVVKKLEEAFAMDCTVEEACLFANISKQSYYNWIDSFPDKKERFDELRHNPFLLARATVIKGIQENYQNAMDYLKRKKKLEFGESVDITSGNKPIPIVTLNSNDIRSDSSDKQDNSVEEEN